MTHLQFKKMTVHDELKEIDIEFSVALWEDSYNGDSVVINSDEGICMCIPKQQAIDLANLIIKEATKYEN